MTFYSRGRINKTRATFEISVPNTTTPKKIEKTIEVLQTETVAITSDQTSYKPGDSALITVQVFFKSPSIL